MGNIAIIPARSGSKGVRNKNIKNLCGKPLIAYTIEAAINSMQFDEIMVSTDSQQYAEIAKQYGAKVPFLRCLENASDSADTWDVVEEVLNFYSNKGQMFESFCLLQPTSPLRNKDDIVNAYDIYSKKASFAVVSVCEAEHSPMWIGRLSDNMELSGFIPRNQMKQRQTNGKFYRLNGAIYIVNCERFKNDKYLYQSGSFAYVMPINRSIDIDSEYDFMLAECIVDNHDLFL